MSIMTMATRFIRPRILCKQLIAVRAANLM